MATTKRRTPAERVTALLTKNKALTEKEVIEQIKGSDRKMVREVRRAMGIDRPSAVADAKGRLAKEPALPAARLIGDILTAYGIRLGPPDVSRLRPKKKKKKSLAHFPTVAEEEAASRVAGFLANVMDSVRGKRGTRAREVRAAIQTIATHLNDRMKGTK